MYGFLTAWQKTEARRAAQHLAANAGNILDETLEAAHAVADNAQRIAANPTPANVVAGALEVAKEVADVVAAVQGATKRRTARRSTARKAAKK